MAFVVLTMIDILSGLQHIAFVYWPGSTGGDLERAKSAKTCHCECHTGRGRKQATKEAGKQELAKKAEAQRGQQNNR